MKNYLVIILFLGLWNITHCQTFVPGQTYFDSTGFVEYRPGNLPILLSAPHGGDWKPDSIPDRNCSGCSYLMDSYTRVITWGMYDAFHKATGCYPHVVMNRLHRIKFDANRDIGDAADGDSRVEEAWHNYHAFIDRAKSDMVENYGRGLLLDIHGHGHAIQRIELGYLLSKSELQSSDAALNNTRIIEESSLRTLVEDNIQQRSHAALLRGEDSFGDLMDAKGFPSVPSSADPFPDDTEAYFSGGYNTARHGSRDTKGPIDAIQIELNQDIRFSRSQRTALIEALTEVSLDYYQLHYNDQFAANFCQLSTGVFQQHPQPGSFILYPNPATDFFTVESDWTDFSLQVFNALGQQLSSSRIVPGQAINVSELPPGYYIIRFYNEGRLLGVEKLVKQQR